MLKNFALTIFMLAFVLLAQASAQTAAMTEKQTAIKELVALINNDNKAEDLVNAMSAQMESAQDATIKAVLDERSDLTAADRKEIEAMLLSDRKNSVKRFQDKLMQKLEFQKMIDEISQIVYDKHYTLEEIRDLTAFYKTPTGQKSLKMITPVMTDSMQLVQERLLPKLPIVIREIQDEDRREIEQKINARKPKPKKNAGA